MCIRDRFKDGRVSVEIYPESGRLLTRRSGENSGRVQDAANENLRLTVGELGDLEIPRPTVSEIFTKTV